MESKSQFFDLTEKYFAQQAALYGNDFYLDVGLSSSDQPETLDEFYQQIKNCQKCRLSQSRKGLVFGTGNPNAKLMCIGEGPGYDEDQQGEPFVGAAGQLLNRILASIGFARDEVYIANIVKCRPPGNRNPESDEVAECMPYLKRQVEMIRPSLILALGKVAGQNLLGLNESIAGLRGRVHMFDGVKVLVTYHPAALLRTPQWKRATWEDIQKLREIYDRDVGDKPPLNKS
ncbi:uracil-DNA glycosylase [candidate division KSB1 bacterium]|nr:uracil-DNA glycosylase [candidate division KSB1 bacterium]NIR72263.1 uracil-DNA glycosylase [candidate division KSB1 bacterium]NIS24234.1 uracil-DNA glycosylase [candidate division KSB1 bacterium]NIT71148.1 uracil-DNA glycosylase [candidate division KSB1 bacterium]NIU24853.1 uracil-DNA glycosylase [candidate division KSB1 bacterium]